MRNLLLLSMFSWSVVMGTNSLLADAVQANLIKNGSFEQAGDIETIAEFWSGEKYVPGKRTSEKASDGDYSMVFRGDGQTHLGLSQVIDLDFKKHADAKLKVSCDFFVTEQRGGLVRPIFFIIGADDTHYSGTRFDRNKHPLGRWNTLEYDLDLSKFEGLRIIRFYILAWSHNNTFFEGEFYVDNVKIHLE